MEKKDKNILKKGIMETKSDFTSNLMDQINAEEKALSNVLTSNAKLETSPDFTSLLMAQLEGKSPAVVYKPVISKKTWFVLASLFLGVVGLAIFFGNANAKDARFHIDLSEIADQFESLFQASSGVVYLVFGVLILSIGLLVEQRLSKSKNLL